MCIYGALYTTFVYTIIQKPPLQQYNYHKVV